MEIKITFLGTSSHTPTAKRNQTGIFLSYANHGILFDCGENIQRQFKIAKISPHKITQLFISHWHGDHVLGIPGLIQTLGMDEYSKTLKIHGPKGTREKFKLLQQIYGKFKIRYEIHEISDIEIDNKEFKIISKPMQHGTPANAYSFVLKEKLRLHKEKITKHKLPNSPLLKDLQEGKDIKYNGKLIKAKSMTYKVPEKKITFIMDTAQNQNAIDISKNADLVICESSYLESEKQLAEERLHLTAKQAATITKKAKAKKLALTHISHRYQGHLAELLKEAKKTFKNTILPKDFDSVIIQIN